MDAHPRLYTNTRTCGVAFLDRSQLHTTQASESSCDTGVLCFTDSDEPLPPHDAIEVHTLSCASSAMVSFSAGISSTVSPYLLSS